MGAGCPENYGVDNSPGDCEQESHATAGKQHDAAVIFLRYRVCIQFTWSCLRAKY